MQLPLWSPDSDWVPPKLSDLPSWDNVKRLGIDTETYDPFLKELGPSVRRGGHIIGVSLAIEDGPRFYLPIRHKGGGNMELEPVLNYLRMNAAKFPGVVVGANFGYDLDYLLEDGIEFKSAKHIRDVQIADPLIYELHKSYSLDALCQRWGEPGKDEQLLKEAAAAHGVDAKAGMHHLHSKFVGPYAEQDAAALLPLLRKQERKIDEENLWDIYNLESDVQPVLVRMRRRGVKVCEDTLSEVENWSIAQEKEALEKIKHLTGVDIGFGNIWKAERVIPALKYIGLELEKTPTGKDSINADFLETVEHPVAQSIVWARKTNKLRTTFAKSLRRYMVKGRIHCTLNQLPIDKDESGTGGIKGARYGRLSAEDPNMQQQPSRDEFAAMWRDVYRPEDGMQWLSADYSQQEPRMTVHFAELCKLPKAYEAAQKYRDDPTADNHQMMAEMAGIDRKPAKELFLGKCYGMGGAKLCMKLGLPTRWVVYPEQRGAPAVFFKEAHEAFEYSRKIGGRCFETAGEEGQQIIDKFDNELPFVNKLAKKCKTKADKTGVIITILGRHCHFPVDQQGQYDWTHKALNRLIQGSSADQTKKALVEVDKAGHFLQLQVHDELCLSVKDRDEAEAVTKIMKECVPLQVPSRVDIEMGPSWGKAK